MRWITATLTCCCRWPWGKPLKWGVRFLKLLELKSFVRIGRNFKAKMALNNKEWHVKTYIHQSAMKISIIQKQHSLPFSSIKVLCTKNLNLTIRFGYNFSNQEMAFRLCTKQSSGGKNQEDKQLKLAPWLDKFALMETRP